MLKTTLHFPCINELWSFKVRVQTRKIKVLTRLNVLVGELSEEEIQMACRFHTATVVQKHAVSF
jgi:hypothetical protein